MAYSTILVKINQKATHRVQPTFINLLALTFDDNLIPHRVIHAAEADLQSFLKVIIHILKMQYSKTKRTRLEIQVKKLYEKPYYINVKKC